MSPLLSLLVLFFAASPSFATKICTVTHGGATTDDSPAILKAFQDCKSDSRIIFSQGVKYNAWTPMYWKDLKNVAIELNGSINLPNSIAEVQTKVKSNKNPGSSNKPWIYIEGTNVSLIGKYGESLDQGSFNSYGEQWWTAKQKTNRPRLLTFHVTTGQIANIKVIKPIAWSFSVSGSNIQINNHFVDARPSDGASGQTTKSFPSNTDGIAISGDNINLDGYYGHNGDDCINITNGGSNIVVKNGYCGYSSHGLSIGSLGKDGSTASVSNVVFQNWTMENADYAARYKSWPGGKGLAENVAWKDIKAINVKTAILVTQKYCDHQKGCSSGDYSTRVNNFQFENFSGSLAPKGGKLNTDAIVLDLFDEQATKLSFKNIDILPSNNKEGATTVVCDPDVFSEADRANLGFECLKGTFKET